MPDPAAQAIVETFGCGGCRAYLAGDPRSGVAIMIDPTRESIDRYVAAASRHNLTIRYIVETHTHADHVSGARALRQATGARLVMHRESPARDVDLRVEDGESLVVGGLRLDILHTPGHTADSICLRLGERLFTGDTLLAGSVGRTDLPTGDPEALYESLFDRLLRLPPYLQVYPAHDYRHLAPSTIGAEIVTNPKLQAADRTAFVAMMRDVALVPPAQLVPALRANISGGRTADELLEDATSRITFLSPDDLAAQLARGVPDLVVVDVRDPAAFAAGHIPGARNLPRGELEALVDDVLPDPVVRLVACCARGHAAPFALATLRELGFARSTALEGGVEAWRRAGGTWAGPSGASA